MKVLFYSHTEFADCTFPLIKELQRQGVDARCYMEINRNFKADNIIEFDHAVNWFGFYKASNLKEFEPYKDCIDLNRLYIIAPWLSRIWWLPGVFVWICAIIHMVFQKADVLHIDWQLAKTSKLLRLVPIAKSNVMTVHDPIIHGNTVSWEVEDKRRKKCFSWANKLILLNREQLNEFSCRYAISLDKIYISHLGAYDSIAKFPIESKSDDVPYILFWGRINPYKGLEYLLEAILKSHDKNPDIKLVIAGAGEEYFDFTPYKNLDFVEWRYRYIGITELVNLIRNSQFAVCPYKDATQSGVIQTAFVLNTPVIATNVGALPKAVENGVTGLIVPPSDSDSLAEAICHLWENSALLSEMRYNIEHKWRPKMSWDLIANQYMDIYKR